MAGDLGLVGRNALAASGGELMNITDLMTEYGNSLTRSNAERDLQKKIASKAEMECGISPPVFRKVAAAFHRDKARDMRDQLSAQVDLFDRLMTGEAP